MKSLDKLRQTIESHPLAWADVRINDALEQVERDIKAQTSIVQHLKQMFGRLKVDIKYLLFDLEATKRERNALMK